MSTPYRLEITFQPDSQFAAEDVREALAFAVEHGAEHARTRLEHARTACLAFEVKWGWPSEEFQQKFEAGEMADEPEFFEWYTAARGMTLWEQRYQVLAQMRSQMQG